MIRQDSILARNPNMILRRIGGEFILVPVYQEDSKNQVIFTFNEVAGRIWELMDNQRNVREIVEILQEEFDVKKSRLEKDVLRFLHALEEIGGINHGMP